MKKKLSTDLQFRLLMEKQQEHNLTLSSEQMGSVSTDLEKIIANWRNAADKNGFLKKLKQDIDQDDHNASPSLDLSDDLQIALEQAAVSGKFHSGDLHQLIQTENHAFVISSLAADCTVNDREWLLTQNRRKQVLNELIAQQRLSTLLDSKLIPTDELGTMIRKVLKAGANIDFKKLSNSDVKLLSKALDILQGIGIQMPDKGELEVLIAEPPIYPDYSIIATGFVGREAELKRLANFLQTGASNNDAWQGLILTGLGGVGKSTLLAKFTEDVIRNNTASVVILDFDRPGIDPSDSAWLEMEMSKQLGRQYPEMKRNLYRDREVFRSANYNAQQSFSGHTSESLESERISKGILYSIRHVIQSSGEKTLLIVLDTYEEVTQRNLTEALVSWINILGDIFYPVKIRVIFSGRIYENGLKQITQHTQVVDTIEVSEFDKKIARLFLQKQGLKRKDITAIIRRIIMPLRPLELRLVARVLADGTTTLEELLKDLEGETDASGTNQLFTGIVYRRILLRMTDPMVKIIACPGLVLRYITPAVVQHVLQPVLNVPLEKEGSTIFPFKIVDEKHAHDLVQKLGNYAWLAYTDDQGRLWHRKDLRRSMLRLIALKESKKVLNIHEEAIKFFQSNSDAVEVIYHRLMLCQTDEDFEAFDLSDFRFAGENLANDFLDLPEKAQILINFAIKGRLSLAEIEQIPNKFFLRVYEKMGRSLVVDRQFSDALRLFRRAERIGINLDANGKGIVDKWEKELLYHTAHWTQLRQLISYQRVNEERFSLKSLIDYVFPAALIYTVDVEMRFVEQLITVAADDKRSVERTLKGPESSTIVSRLSYCLLVLHQAHGLSPAIKDALSRIMRVFLAVKEGPAIKPALLLMYLCDYPEKPLYLLKSGGLKMDPRWLSWAKDFAENGHRRVLWKLQMQLSHPLKIRSILSMLDGSRSEIQRTAITIDLSNVEDEKRHAFLHGPMTLFRDPARYAVLDACEKGLPAPQLAMIIRECLAIDLPDLDNILAKQISQSLEYMLDTVIEIIDRSWALEKFLSLIYEETGNPRVLMVLTAVRVADESLSALLLRTDMDMKANPPSKRPVNGLAAHYRSQILNSKNGLNESTPISGPDLSDAAINERVIRVKSDLRRIIKDYLNDDSSLYKIADDLATFGAEGLQAVANDDDQYLTENSTATALLEVIVRIDGSRPSFMIRNGEPDKATSPVGNWGNILDARADELRHAIACVGRLNVGEEHVGTGFLVQDNFILTNRHVLQGLGMKNDDDEWVLAPSATIDFGFEFRAQASRNRRKIKRVTFAGKDYIDGRILDHNKLDLALLELEPTNIDSIPKRLLAFDISPDWATSATTVFTIGYPGNPGIEGITAYGSLLERLFKSTFGYKRLAPGEILQMNDQIAPWTTGHDSTTLGGNSGSLVIVAGREFAAAGLHYGGTLRTPRQNWAHILGKTLSATDGQSSKTLKEHLLEQGVNLNDRI